MLRPQYEPVFGLEARILEWVGRIATAIVAASLVLAIASVAVHAEEVLSDDQLDKVTAGWGLSTAVLFFFATQAAQAPEHVTAGSNPGVTIDGITYMPGVDPWQP